MSLSAGVRLGPYEILAPIGAGGMGEVYKARDTRLERIVAVKVLPEPFASDPQFRDRFEREARAVSALDHPNICPLYDVGEAPGSEPSATSNQPRATSPQPPATIRFLVMQYLEGETLANRIGKGAVPLSEAMAIAIQVASALEKAHRAGIVHRDLKPGNIMLTKAGAKLLDFGLAKSSAPVGANSGLSMLPTTPAALTAQGTILGTFQYMSPEQLDGQEADARSDIFGFGAVLYEMLTGRKAFAGKSNATLIAAIVGSDPPVISSVVAVAPLALDRVVKTCLAKEPDERWQNAGDLMRELKWISENPANPANLANPRNPANSRSRVLPWAVSALLLIVAIAAASLGRLGYLNPAPVETPSYVASIVLPDGVRIPNGAEHFALSPDGRRLAFAATDTGARGPGPQRLWVRPLNAGSAQPLAGTEGADSPFWSPDSRFVAFNAQGKLKKIDVAGGPPITLCDATFNGTGAWNAADVIVFNARGGDGLYRVSAAGGTPVPVTKVDPATGDQGHSKPFFLPDGRHFVYQAGQINRSRAIYVGSLDPNEKHVLLLQGGGTTAYALGHVLFVRQGTLLAQPFDTSRLELRGEPVPVAEQVAGGGSVGNSNAYTVSANGVLAYQAGANQTTASQLVWLDRAGKQLGMLGDEQEYGAPELSPDGKRAVITLPRTAGNLVRNLWIFDLARGLPTRFTFDEFGAVRAIWSADGSRLVFNSRHGNKQGRLDLFQKASSGVGNDETLVGGGNANYTPWSWSADSRFILYQTGAGDSNSQDLWLLPLSGDRKPLPFLTSPFNELQGQFSPDARWVAYVSNESGRQEIYVVPFAEPNGPAGGSAARRVTAGKWQVSTTGGTFPRWRRDGKELFYAAPDNKLMAAAVNGTASGFEVGVVRPLFEMRPSLGQGYFYDVSADGQRFLVNTAAERTQGPPAPITLVVNWASGLKK